MQSNTSLPPPSLGLLNSLSIAGEARLDLLQRHAVLRPLRPGERRLDGREVELEHVGEDRVGRGLSATQALRLGSRPRPAPAAPAARPVSFRYCMVSSSIGKKPQVAPYSGAMLPMVARSSIDRSVEARTEELDELLDHAALAQHLRDGQHEVGRGDALLQLAGAARRRSPRGSPWRPAGRAWPLPPRCRRRPSPAPHRPLTMVVWQSVPTRVSG